MYELMQHFDAHKTSKVIDCESSDVVVSKLGYRVWRLAVNYSYLGIRTQKNNCASFAFSVNGVVERICEPSHDPSACSLTTDTPVDSYWSVTSTRISVGAASRVNLVQVSIGALDYDSRIRRVWIRGFRGYEIEPVCWP